MEIERQSALRGIADPAAVRDGYSPRRDCFYEPHLALTIRFGPAHKGGGFGVRDIVLNAFSYQMVAAGLTFTMGFSVRGRNVVASGHLPAQ